MEYDEIHRYQEKIHFVILRYGNKSMHYHKNMVLVIWRYGNKLMHYHKKPGFAILR